jgi:glucosyl-dolichyl phosphate glucuronosyltransferase
MNISVVIASKDRGQEISLTLESILAQSIDTEAFEILLIDNCSNLENVAILKSFEANFPHLIRYFHENQPSLSLARNRGIKESKNEIIAFLDDDAIPSTEWLKSIQNCFQSFPEIDALGGKVISKFSAPLPDWVNKDLELYLSSFDMGEEMIDLNYNDYPRGANMAFRKSVFTKIGDFNHKFGRKGASLMSYEEIELCYRIEKGGGKIVYLPQAEVFHLIKSERITPLWFKKRIYWQGRSEGLFEWLHFTKKSILLKFWQSFINYIGSNDPFKKVFYLGFIHAVLSNIWKWKLA